MANGDLSGIPTGEFAAVGNLLASNESLQIAFAIMIIGIIIIVAIYQKFSSWVKTRRFSYSRPHVSRFLRKAILPFFAIALITSTNVYIQSFELFGEEGIDLEPDQLTPHETFAKIMDTFNILVIGYTISQLIPIALIKRDKSTLERDDFSKWCEIRGFRDDDNDLFHKYFKWVPPKKTPEDLTEEEFQKHLQTDEGKKFLENFRTAKGNPIGSYEKLIDKPFEEWKKSERKKYEKYFDACISGRI